MGTDAGDNRAARHQALLRSPLCADRSEAETTCNQQGPEPQEALGVRYNPKNSLKSPF